jgi:hypothetical protein
MTPLKMRGKGGSVVARAVFFDATVLRGFAYKKASD